MSIVQRTAPPGSLVKDFQTETVPRGTGGVLAWKPSTNIVPATVVQAVVRKYALLVFDLPLNPGATVVRDVGIFNSSHPWNFVRPNDVQMSTAKAAAGQVSGLGNIDINTAIAGDTATISDGVNAPVVFQWITTAGDITDTPILRGVVLSGVSDAADEVLFRAAVNASVLRITASAGAGDSTDLDNDEIGAHGNVTITETGSSMTATGMTAGVNASDLPVFAVATQDGEIGDKIRVIVAGVVRVDSAAGTLQGEYLVASSGVATVVRKNAVAGVPRLVLGRSLENRLSQSGTEEDATVLCIFNGLRGIGVSSAVYS